MSPEIPEKRRFTLNLPFPALEALEAIQVRRGHGALADVIREAVEVYIDLQEGLESGLELHFKDPKNKRSGPIWLLPGPGPGTK